MMTDRPSIQNDLTALFDELRLCFAEKPNSLGDRLQQLFSRMGGCSFEVREAPPQPLQFERDDLAALRRLLEALAHPVNVIEKAGRFGNPWAAAALRHDEVRNAGVLAWLLDPRGGHGCGSLLLTDLLGRIGRHLQFGFPDGPSPNCVVSVEDCPDGINASRVDIQIDDPDRFFIVIEVKIGAPEQPGQLERYCEVARARACGMRPWAVVFLTPDGRLPTTAGERREFVVPLAWSSVAASLRQAARLRASENPTSAGVPRFLANTFAAHIASF
jgi:hypothetical protein